MISISFYLAELDLDIYIVMNMVHCLGSSTILTYRYM